MSAFPQAQNLVAKGKGHPSPFLSNAVIYISLSNYYRIHSSVLRMMPKWKIENIRRFMSFIGSISSIFDYATYSLMWFVFGATTVNNQALFQTGWFVESLMTQALIVHVIRTAKIPFFQSWASFPMLLITATVMAVGIYLPFSPIAASLVFFPYQPFTFSG